MTVAHNSDEWRVVGLSCGDLLNVSFMAKRGPACDCSVRLGVGAK